MNQRNFVHNLTKERLMLSGAYNHRIVQGLMLLKFIWPFIHTYKICNGNYFLKNTFLKKKHNEKRKRKTIKNQLCWEFIYKM